jgi:hypothetical protein
VFGSTENGMKEVNDGIDVYEPFAMALFCVSFSMKDLISELTNAGLSEDQSHKVIDAISRWVGDNYPMMNDIVKQIIRDATKGVDENPDQPYPPVVPKS